MSKNPLQNLFSDIANAIRNKTGEISSMKPDEFVEKINSISIGGGGSANLSPLKVTENGVYKPTKPVDGFSEVDVKVPIPEGYIKPEGEIEVTENGTVNVAQYENAVVNVPIPDGYIKPEGEVEITENGTIDITQYASAVVNVPSSGGGTEDADLRVLEVTKNGTYKASENKIGSKTSITFNQDYAGFVDMNGMPCVVLENVIPSLAFSMVDGMPVVDDTPLHENWSYILTNPSLGQTMAFKAEELPFDISGGAGQAFVELQQELPGIYILICEAARLNFAIFVAANVEEIFTEGGASADMTNQILSMFRPGCAYFVDLAAMGMTPYEVTFEIGTDVPDPCDGYSEVNVDVKPNLTSLSVTENGTYTIEKTYADSFTYNANTEHNVPEGSLGAFKLDVQLPELDLSTLDINTGNIDLSNFAKDWAFSLSIGDDVISFSAEELPITLDNGDVIKLAIREFPELRIASHRVAMFCPSNAEEYIRKLLELMGENLSEEEVQAMLSMLPPNTVFFFDLSSLSSDYEATFSYNPLPTKYDGYSSVKVEVPAPAPIPTQEKTLTVTENGTNTVVPDDGYNISKVTVTTKVPIPEPVLVDLSVSENGIYTPDESIDGYSSVMVNIPSEGIMLNDGIKVSRVAISKDVTSIDNDFSSISPSYTTYIKYDDTMEEWEAIPKIDNWNAGKIDEVRCTDGNIQINGSMLTYVLDSATDTYSITDCPTDATEAVIPRTYSGKAVSKLNQLAFDACSSLTNIIIPDSITDIGEYTFRSCTNLTKVKLPNSITSIGSYVFNKCSNLTDITIPDGVTTIGGYTFSNCDSLTQVTIPDGVMTIGNCAFSNCDNLESVSIPASVNNIPKYTAFSGCRKLVNLVIDPDNAHYSFKDGVLYNKEKTKIYSIISASELIVPSTVTSFSISDGAVYLTSVDFEENSQVISIQATGFNGSTNLTYVRIPDSVTSIGAQTFRQCSNLKTVILGKNIASIGEKCFYQTSADIYITNMDSWIRGNVTLGDNAIGASCKMHFIDSNDEEIVNITIPEDITSIRSRAFDKFKNIQSVVIHDGVTNIEDFAFNWCDSLTNVTIGSGVINIGKQAFYNNSSDRNDLIITYNGTMEQWNTITKGNSWVYVNHAYTIHCTDGDITKS